LQGDRDPQSESFTREWLSGQSSSALLDSFAQTSEPAAGIHLAAAPVVGYLGNRLPILGRDPDPATPGIAVAEDVRGAFSNGPREDWFNRRWKAVVLFIDPHFDAGCGHRFAGASELSGEGRLPVAGHGLAHFAQRIACHFLDVLHLVLRKAGRSLDESSGELAFQRDHRKAVSEQIVKIPRETEPLLADGKPGDLLARQ
jgi:hypothetical protein